MSDARNAEHEDGPPNCLYGANVHNRHNNCPYSLLCAVCDLYEDALPNGRSESD